MDRQPTAVEYRRQLRRQLSDLLAELQVDSLTLTELRELLRLVAPVIERSRAGDRSAGREKSAQPSLTG